jgi:6-phospho-3-hexuloisomerase
LVRLQKIAADSIIDSVRDAMDAIPSRRIDRVIKMLLEAHAKDKKIMIIGVGRSGLVGRAFAMRLMHLGFQVHVVGETITPALGPGDILFAISGSGTTTFVVDAAEIAKKVGAKIIIITSYPKSRLGKLANYSIVIPGRIRAAIYRDYFSRQILGNHEPLAPLGTRFEVSAMVFLDSLIVELMEALGKTEAEMKARHATVE